MNRRQALLSIAALPAVAAGVAVAGGCLGDTKPESKTLHLSGCLGCEDCTCECTDDRRADRAADCCVVITGYNPLTRTITLSG
jgi:hypothetical protein